MPKVIINNTAYEALEGELLLDVARRNGAHIGFVCNGNGICTTCECKVLAGADKLTPLTSPEKDWLHPDRLARGHRLSCQTFVEAEGKEGTLVVLTRVEEFKRQYLGIFQPDDAENAVENLGKFSSNLTMVTLEHMAQAPIGLVNTVNRLGLAKFLFPWNDVDEWIRAGQRVVDTELARDGVDSPFGRRRSRPVEVDVEIEMVDD